MKLRLLVAALAALTAGVASAGSPDSGRWSFTKPITLPPLDTAQFIEVLLDADVYRDAAPTLADVRVREGDHDVAYVVRRHETARTRTERTLPLLDLVELPDHAVRFVVDLGMRPGIHNRLRVRVADEAKNFRVPVTIETSTDRQTWAVARGAGFIYVVESDARATDTSVAYPDSTARYVRATVAAADGRAIAVTGATMVFETAGERDVETTPAAIVERADDAKTKTTRLLLDLGSRRPLDRLDLEIGDRSFNRVVRIEASADRERWWWMGSCAVSAIDTPRLRERNTTLPFAETAARYLRLTIENFDDRPLDIRAITAKTVRRGVVIEARPDGAYRLAYGNPRATAPRYDLVRVFPYLGTETLPLGTLGPATALTAPLAVAWNAEPALVWGAMAVGVLVLGTLLFRLARQVRPAE